MSDKELGIWDKYDVNVIRTYKGRQSIICETDKGLKLIKELNCHSQKIEFQSEVKSLLKNSDVYNIDCFVQNIDGEIITKDKDEISYVMKDWFDGREIDVRNRNEILLAVKILAMMHCKMVFNNSDITQNHRFEDLLMEFDKHNKELKKVRNFIRDKNKKTDYEICFINVFEMFSKDGLKAIEQLKLSKYNDLKEDVVKRGTVCHGDYNQHNILITKKLPAITNFDKCRVGVQVGDLYNFMRKILEKNKWDIELGKDMIRTYNEINVLNDDELENLLLRFIYPEKFWKIANHYFNSNKAWTPVKNIEKLEMLAEQNKIKWNFMEEVFNKYMCK